MFFYQGYCLGISSIDEWRSKIKIIEDIECFPKVTFTLDLCFLTVSSEKSYGTSCSQAIPMTSSGIFMPYPDQ